MPCKCVTFVHSRCRAPLSARDLHSRPASGSGSIVKARRGFLHFLLLTYAVFFLVSAGAQTAPAPALLDPTRGGVADPSLDSKVEALLRKMTLVEKVGQLVQYSAGQPTGPGTGRTDYKDMIDFGAYSFYRLGIAPDGTWHFFVSGD